MNKKITLGRKMWLEILYFNKYIYIYFFLSQKVFFESSFRPSGPGSVASFFNFSTVLDEPG